MAARQSAKRADGNVSARHSLAVGDPAETFEHRADDAAWTTVEQGFFASAPPELPEPAPEPLTFDDLEAPEPQPSERTLRLRRAAATATAALQPLGRRLRGAATTAATWLARERQVLGTRVGTLIAAALFRGATLDRRRIALVIAGVVFATALPAAIVTSQSPAPSHEAVARETDRPSGRPAAGAPPAPRREPPPSPTPSVRPAVVAKVRPARSTTTHKRRLRHRAIRRAGR
jgi:hypothetical protein